MLISAIILQPFFWLFVMFALVDGLATLFQIGLVVSVSRIAFAFTFIVLNSANFGVLAITTETLALIAVLDFSFLLREIKQHAGNDILNILGSRLGSYLYTLVPAGIFSTGVLYIASLPLSNGVNSEIAITLLGVTSTAILLIILFVARTFRSESLK